jgi:Flp pilus assembly pilin Flp
MTDLAIIIWRGAFARFDRKRHDEGGATVLEWALIAAVVVVAASIVAAVILNIVNKKSSDLQNCADQPVGSKC